MRDYYTKENMRGDAFHVADAGLYFEPARLSFEAEPDTGREGVIRVLHREGKPARGYVYPSERCMRGVREQFAPAADGTGWIRWQFDGRGIAPGRTIRGFFRVLSPYGEYRIPYTVRIAERGELLRERDDAAGPRENECSREDFPALAKEDPARAAAFFYSSRFPQILTEEADRTLYRGLSGKEGNLQNLEEFLICACHREKTLYEPVEKELTLQIQGRRGREGGRPAESRAERALQAHRQRVLNSGITGQAGRAGGSGSGPGAGQVRAQETGREDLVYLPLHIRRRGTGLSDLIIRAEGSFLPAAPFRVPVEKMQTAEPVPAKDAEAWAPPEEGRFSIGVSAPESGNESAPEPARTPDHGALAEKASAGKTVLAAEDVPAVEKASAGMTAPSAGNTSAGKDGSARKEDSSPEKASGAKGGSAAEKASAAEDTSGSEKTSAADPASAEKRIYAEEVYAEESRSVFGNRLVKQEETVFTVRIPVNRAALHAGRNYGRILIQGPFNDAAVPVEVHCTSSVPPVRRRQARELRLLELQLMRLYVDLRLTQMQEEERAGDPAGAVRTTPAEAPAELPQRSVGEPYGTVPGTPEGNSAAVPQRNAGGRHGTVGSMPEEISAAVSRDSSGGRYGAVPGTPEEAPAEDGRTGGTGPAAGSGQEAWRGECFRHAARLIDALSTRSHGDIVPRLYGVHLLLLQGQEAEAARALGRIAVRYAGDDGAQNLSARFTGERESAYCYRQYLYARCYPGDARLQSRVVRFLKGLYRSSGDWRTAWMLMDLAPEYAPGTAARWNFLRHQYENGCSSPVMWIEAWEMVRSDPQILLPGSSVRERWARDDFGLHVLWYAAANNALTDRAAGVMVSLAEKKKTFSPLLYKGLCAACTMERFAGNTVRDGAAAEGPGQAQGRPAGKAASPEQAAAEAAGKETGVSARTEKRKETGVSIPMEEAEPAGSLSRPKERNTAGSPGPAAERTAAEQAAGQGDPSPQPDSVGTSLLRAICILLVRGQDLSPRAHKWYDRALREGVALTKLEENWRESLPAEDPARRLPAGRNAVLRTTAARAVRAVLVYDRFRREEFFPIREGVAFLSVYGDANTVFLEDAAGNRFAKSLPYTLDVLRENSPRLQEEEGPAESAAQDRRESLRTQKRPADPGIRGRQEDLHALADRIGFGSREETGFVCTEESVRAAGLLLDSGELTREARTRLLLECLTACSGLKDRARMEFFLKKADPARCTDRSRARLLGWMEQAGSYEKALGWLISYGTEGVDARLLGRICLGVPWEEGYRAAAVPLGWEAFLRGNTEMELLERLAVSMDGFSEELIRLRTACADTGASTAGLDRRIVRQSLYTGAVTKEHARIIADAGKRLEETLLPAAAQFADFAFSNGFMMGNRMTDLVTGLLTGGDEVPHDICRIAYLKELSMRQEGEIQERERAAAKAGLSVLLSKGIIFPFYRQFPGYDDRLDLYAEETLVQYHPSENTGGHIVFHYTTSRRGEAGNYRERPMKEMYRGFFVSGFLLFYGEQMHYYITDDPAGKHVVQSGMIGQDARIMDNCSGRFGLINETTRAAALREYDEALDLLSGYYRRSYLESELFRR